jgi:NADH:ubiquinone oxidoreductase subunit 6 (subunit J)
MKARQNNFKLYIQLVQAFGLILTLLFSFIGGLYMFSGNMLLAGLFSVIFVVAIYYLIIKFCWEKENRKRKGYPTSFYALFGLYAFINLTLSVFVLHFVNVEFFEKEEIKKIGLNKVKGLEDIYSDYETQYLTFTSTLESQFITNINALKSDPNNSSVRATLNAQPFNCDNGCISSLISQPNLVQALQKRTALLNDEFALKPLELIGENKEEYFEKAKQNITNWNRLEITSTMEQLNSKITADNEALNNELKMRTANTCQLSVPQKSFMQNSLINHPIDLAKKHLGVSSIIVILLFQLFILLPYFLTKGRQFGS